MWHFLLLVIPTRVISGVTRKVSFIEKWVISWLQFIPNPVRSHSHQSNAIQVNMPALVALTACHHYDDDDYFYDYFDCFYFLSVAMQIFFFLSLFLLFIHTVCTMRTIWRTRMLVAYRILTIQPVNVTVIEKYAMLARVSHHNNEIYLYILILFLLVTYSVHCIS